MFYFFKKAVAFSCKSVIIISALLNGANKTVNKFAVLSGEVAVPCTRNPL